MKIRFDEETWSQIEEYLRVAQLCGENAGQLHGYAKGVVQRTVASVGTEKEVTAPEADHALNILAKLRNSTHDAAQAFASAVARIDDVMREFDPAAGKIRSRQKV